MEELKLYYRGMRKKEPASFRIEDISANDSEQIATPRAIISHIINGSFASPFISVSQDHEIAKHFATDRGVVLTLTNLKIINPVKQIRHWMTETPNLTGAEKQMGYNAIKSAEDEDELLVFRKIPAKCIVDFDEIKR